MGQMGFNSPRDFSASTLMVTGNSAGGLVVESAAMTGLIKPRPNATKAICFFMERKFKLLNHCNSILQADVRRGGANHHVECAGFDDKAVSRLIPDCQLCRRQCQHDRF